MCTCVLQGNRLWFPCAIWSWYSRWAWRMTRWIRKGLEEKKNSRRCGEKVLNNEIAQMNRNEILHLCFGFFSQVVIHRIRIRYAISYGGPYANAYTAIMHRYHQNHQIIKGRGLFTSSLEILKKNRLHLNLIINQEPRRPSRDFFFLKCPLVKFAYSLLSVQPS